MNERIEKKMVQIAKIEKKIEKWEASKTEEKFWKENGSWFKYWAMQWKEYDGSVKTEEDFYNAKFDEYVARCDEEIRRAKRDLDIAKAQLEKIKKQEETKNAKESTLNEMPEALTEFKKKMEDAWNEWDKKERDMLRSEYKNLGYKEFTVKFKGGYSKMNRTDDEIEKENKRTAEALVLNLINRVIEKTGQITDAKGLKVTQGNQGYAVINGFVIGEKGTAEVESISAGGYNIQRYHIRTLVK